MDMQATREPNGRFAPVPKPTPLTDDRVRALVAEALQGEMERRMAMVQISNMPDSWAQRARLHAGEMAREEIKNSIDSGTIAALIVDAVGAELDRREPHWALQLGQRLLLAMGGALAMLAIVLITIAALAGD